MKRGLTTLALAIVIATAFAPFAVLADGWYNAGLNFMRDGQYNLDVNCKVGCSSLSLPATNPGYMRLIDKSTTNAVTVDSGYQGGSIDNRNFLATESMLYARNGTGSVVPVDAASGSDTLQVTTGGQKLFKLSATTCTQIGGGVIISRVWSAGSETATLTLYTNSGCTSALWSGTPTTTPVVLEADNSSGFGIWYKMSATPATNDYATTN